MRMEEEAAEKVKDDWKFVAMVMDRMFLWIFTLAVLGKEILNLKNLEIQRLMFQLVLRASSCRRQHSMTTGPP